jgi:hypothetical protein
MDLSSNSENSQNSVSSLNKSNYFPFHKGKGLEKTLEMMGYKYEWIKPGKIIKIISLDKFVVCKDNEDFEKVIYIRPDNIKKKLKSSFHKNIIKIINNKIKKAYSDKNIKENFFINLPQSFIRNVNISENSTKMEMKFGQLLINWDDEKNKKTKKFLDKNPDLSEKSNWNLIQNMTYKELLEAFFLSEEFEKSIIALKTKAEKSKKKDKKVSSQYIENYINIALKYIDFFSSPINNEDLEISKKNNNSLLSLDNECNELFGDEDYNSKIMITPENDIAPSKFEQPPKEPFVVLEDEDLVIIKNLYDEEESKKDLSLFENSLDENGIKADCFEKDIKNVITQHDKIHS